MLNNAGIGNEIHWKKMLDINLVYVQYDIAGIMTALCVCVCV